MQKGGGVPWNRVRTTSSGWRAAVVANPAIAPAEKFSHLHFCASSGAGIDTGKRSCLRFWDWIKVATLAYLIFGFGELGVRLGENF